MMSRYLSLLVSSFLACLILLSSLKATIISVKQDGTGDHTTIQAGINASSNFNGDTVLVWPGVYYENISYNGKHITVASLYISTPDNWYIYNTIIDGNMAGKCVTMNGGNDVLTINGFTIRNGYSWEGYGGIFTDQSTASIKNCIIEHNEGCGITGNYSTIYLSNTTIRYNHGFYGGGAIAYGLYMDVIFDPVNKCNIYLNYAPVGCEIAKNWFSPGQIVIVDTFTVIEPDYHFVYSFDTYNLPVNDIEMQIGHAYLEPVDNNLYVNPVTGDNNNNGLSQDEPLRTIACADLNDDGREDIVIVGQKTEVYFGYESGFQLLTLETNSFKGSVSIADFDKDGTNDIAASLSLYPYDYTLLKFYKNLGNNNIIVEDSIIFQPLCFGDFNVSDFNNDSLPDLLFHPADNNNLLFFYNQENFHFGDSVFIPMADFGETTRRSACADFDGNGFNDIVTIRSWGAPLPANVNILFNDGNGGFVENPITKIETHNPELKTQNLQCYPNPFKTKTTISFAVKEKGKTQLQVFDLNEQLIKTIVNKELNNGENNVEWNGTDKNGREVKSGVYFVTLNSPGKTEHLKIIKR